MSEDGAVQQTAVEREQEFTATVRRRDLKRFLEVPYAVAEEAIIRTDEDGMSVEVVDPTNVLMGAAEINEGAFAEWDSGDAAFGVGLRAVLKVVDWFDTEQLELHYDPETMMLSLSAGSYLHRQKCMEPGSLRDEPDPLPEMDFTFKGEIPASLVREVFTWADEFAEIIRIGYDPTNQEFWAELDEHKDFSMGEDHDSIFGVSADELGQVEEPGHADSRFSLDYPTDAVEALPSDGSVEVHLGEELPMCIRFDLAGGHGAGQFVNAPRIHIS